jgi:hypothetical protein
MLPIFNKKYTANDRFEEKISSKKNLRDANSPARPPNLGLGVVRVLGRQHEKSGDGAAVAKGARVAAEPRAPNRPAMREIRLRVCVWCKAKERGRERETYVCVYKREKQKIKICVYVEREREIGRERDSQIAIRKKSRQTN